jgi:hypothetical protein
MKLDDLPLFADDKQLAEAILGKTRAKDWQLFIQHYEGRGLPSLDPFTEARYVPAVRRFLDSLNGVNGAAPFPARDGPEQDQWHSKQLARRR